MLDLARCRPRSLVPVAILALMVACRERAPVLPDSALAQDLAMAQRSLPAQTVFNDAPLGRESSAAPSAAAAAPTPRRETPRARTPRPAPSAGRERPAAPVARAPQRSTPAPVAAPVVEAPLPAPARTPGPVAGVIGAGTRIGMTTNGRVCTRSALVGDKFTATVSNVTVGSNGALIPAGATVVLEVASVDRADPAEASRISFRVRSIDVEGSAHPAEGSVATLGSLETVQSSGGNDRTKVVGGAVAGAVLGRILGGSTKATVIGAAAGAAAGSAVARGSRITDACLPEGSPLQLTLSRRMVVQRIGAI